MRQISVLNARGQCFRCLSLIDEPRALVPRTRGKRCTLNFEGSATRSKGLGRSTRKRVLQPTSSRQLQYSITTWANCPNRKRGVNPTRLTPQCLAISFKNLSPYPGFPYSPRTSIGKSVRPATRLPSGPPANCGRFDTGYLSRQLASQCPGAPCPGSADL